MNDYDQRDALANRLRRWMQEWGFGIEAFAEYCGLQPSLVLDILDGQLTEPDDVALLKIALAVKRPPSWVQRGIESIDLTARKKDVLRLADLNAIYLFCLERELAEPLRQKLLQKAFQRAARQRRHAPLSASDLDQFFGEVLDEAHPVAALQMCPVTDISCSYPWLCRDGNCLYLRQPFAP